MCFENMSRRKGTTKHPKTSLFPFLPANSMSEANEDILIQPTKQSRLLSLPAELRMLIWEAVANIPIGITEMWNVRSPQVPIDTLTGQKFRNSRHSQNNWQTNHTHKNDDSDPMGWLRTNHQIYQEGKPFFDKLLRLRICDTVDLKIFLCPQWSPSVLNRNTVQYLSFCYRVKIQHDPRGGFTIQRANERLSPASLLPLLPEFPDLEDRMPSLKGIRLQLIFLCHPELPLLRSKSQEQLNLQGRPLDQSRNHDSLVFRGSEEQVTYVAYKLVYESMLGNFVKMGKFVGASKLKVHVDVEMDRIEHDCANDSGNSVEACWCKNRYIDLETFPVTVLTGAIQEALADD